jgi:hypothetical protein
MAGPDPGASLPPNSPPPPRHTAHLALFSPAAGPMKLATRWPWLGVCSPASAAAAPGASMLPSSEVAALRAERGVPCCSCWAAAPSGTVAPMDTTCRQESRQGRQAPGYQRLRGAI